METDGAASVDVCTATPNWLEVHGPIFNPRMVTVNGNASMAAPEVVSTNLANVVAPHVADKFATLLAPTDTVGVTDIAKKPSGYMRVMEPPEGIGVVGVKARLTATEDLCAIRSDASMSNLTDVTAVWHEA
jgi:hypothetical protein